MYSIHFILERMLFSYGYDELEFKLYIRPDMEGVVVGEYYYARGWCHLNN